MIICFIVKTFKTLNTRKSSINYLQTRILIIDIATTKTHRNITFVGFCNPSYKYSSERQEVHWWMWVMTILVDSSAALLCLSNDLTLFTRGISQTQNQCVCNAQSELHQRFPRYLFSALILFYGFSHKIKDNSHFFRSRCQF